MGRRNCRRRNAVPGSVRTNPIVAGPEVAAPPPHERFLRLLLVGSEAERGSPILFDPRAFFLCSKTYCGYCKRVKQLLTQLGASYKVIELDKEGECLLASRAACV